MNKRIILSLTLGLILIGQFIVTPSYSNKTYPTGAILDDVLYDSIPRKAVQLSRSYTGLPKAHSLKEFAPIPKSQVGGTCVGWATAYAARTATESIAIGRRDMELSTQNAFSPLFVYKSVRSRHYNDPNPSGQHGIATAYALDFLKNEGAVRMPRQELDLSFMQILLSLYSGLKRYPIADYVRLYESWRQLAKADETVRTKMVKKSISENKLVIISINSTPSLHFTGTVWNPTENPARRYNGHAVCVVGYDDDKHGGAFEILNSWGTDWGNRGYVWIPYTVFDKFALEAYEMIENLSIYPDAANYSGFVEIELYGSKEGMPIRFADGHYQTINSYPSGTVFRYLIGNEKRSFIYAFAGDSGSNDTTRIFPPEGQNISPIFDYSGKNMVAFPGEFTWIQLDEKVGTDYLVVLFAKEALDIDSIRQRFEKTSGSFSQRVAKAVGNNFISVKNAKYEANEIRFSAQSKNPKSVFGLLLAIDHKARLE